MSRYCTAVLVTVSAFLLAGCGATSSREVRATLPVKFVTPADARVVVSPAKLRGRPVQVDRYLVLDLLPGSCHKVEVTLADGKKLTGHVEITENACQERRAILPVVISESHVIKPAIEEGKRVTYVVYEKTLPRQRARAAKASKRTWLNPKWWFLSEKERIKAQADAARQARKPVNPRIAAQPLGGKEWRRLAKDGKFFLKPVTPASDAAVTRTEAEARKRLVFYTTESGGKRDYDPVVRDELEAKARGGGYLYPYAKSDDRLDVAQLDNLSSRAVPASLWKAMAKGPDKNVRHIVGCGDLPVKKAALRGNVLLVLRLKEEPRKAK